MPYAQLSRVRLEFFRKGSGSERILFVHGMQASAQMWSAVQRIFPEETYSSIAVNNRGAGKSDAPPNEADFGVEIFAADLFELVTQLGWSDFTLVGHSLGAVVATKFAVDHPHLIKRLVLLSPGDPDGLEATDDAEIDAFIEQRMAWMGTPQAANIALDAVGQDIPSEVMLRLHTDMMVAPERRLRGSIRSMFTMKAGDQLKDLSMPILVGGGDQDKIVPIERILAVWAKCPKGSGLHIWYGLGHSPNLDAPGAFVELLCNFIRRLPDPDR